MPLDDSAVPAPAHAFAWEWEWAWVIVAKWRTVSTFRGAD